MDRDGLPDDPAKQWEILLCIIAFEEKKIDRRPDNAIETLTYIFNHQGIRHIFTEWIRQMTLCYDKQQADDDTPRKNDEIALIWRQRGNVKFKAELYEESHTLYTKSVLYAHKESPLYSVALANRSAASLRLKRYKESLRDVQRALNHEYPPELQHKLYLRRAECFLEMGARHSCMDAMRLAMRHNATVRLRGMSKVEFEKSYASLEQKLGHLQYEAPIDCLNLPELFLGENPHFKNACNAVELVRNDRYGRHVVVKEPVKRGDVIFAEEPFASVKLPDKDLLHPNYCDFCCGSDLAMIGCTACSRVVFCDEACHYLGKITYHRWECAGVRSNIFPTIGIAHLAFRVMLKYVQKGFPRLPPNFQEPKTAAELLAAYTMVDNVQIYRSEYSSFYSMFNLTSNFETAANTDTIQYALSSTMLILYLEKYTDFFEYFPGCVGFPLPMSEMKLLCAGLIFRTLGQLVTNAHTVMEINTGPKREIPTCIQENLDGIANPWRRVGTGVYPTVSMMNHSCEPNITNLFYKNVLYVKVIRELPKGGEVLNCYGPHYARQSTEERGLILRTQYGFQCRCPACLDETRKDFASLFSAYACASCKGPVTWVTTRMACHQCPNEFPLQKALSVAETAESMHTTVYCKRCQRPVRVQDIDMLFYTILEVVHEAMSAKTKEERCDRMARAYRLMQLVFYRHNNILRKASDDQAMLYAAIGEYSKSIELIKQNIQSFEYQYGSFSVEVTNEIRKMANLMLGRIMKFLDNPESDDRQPIPIKDWIRETMKIARTANQLMELNFGTWQPMYKALKDNEEVLEDMLAGPRHDDPEGLNSRLQTLSLI